MRRHVSHRKTAAAEARVGDGRAAGRAAGCASSAGRAGAEAETWLRAAATSGDARACLEIGRRIEDAAAAAAAAAAAIAAPAAAAARARDPRSARPRDGHHGGARGGASLPDGGCHRRGDGGERDERDSSSGDSSVQLASAAQLPEAGRRDDGASVCRDRQDVSGCRHQPPCSRAAAVRQAVVWLERARRIATAAAAAVPSQSHGGSHEDIANAAQRALARLRAQVHAITWLRAMRRAEEMESNSVRSRNRLPGAVGRSQVDRP